MGASGDFLPQSFALAGGNDTATDHDLRARIICLTL
jgi:hypothetical protein